MELVRSVVVFDAAELDAESEFWAAMLGGQVIKDEAWHSVVDTGGQWRIGVQFVPTHIAPNWPTGNPQQVHLDLHVEDPRAAHEHAVAVGARVLQSGDLASAEGHCVYADPAGHPFCIGWGHPTRQQLVDFVAKRSEGPR